MAIPLQTTITSREAFVDLISKSDPKYLPLITNGFTVNSVDPISLVDRRLRNTYADLTTSTGDRVYFKYRRVPMGEAFGNETTLAIAGTYFKANEITEAFCQVHDVKLTPEDVDFGEVYYQLDPNRTSTPFRLIAKPDSLAWQGSCLVFIKGAIGKIRILENGDFLIEEDGNYRAIEE